MRQVLYDGNTCAMNESRAVVEVGLWSTLSTAPVVKSPRRILGGHATLSASNLVQMPSAMSAVIWRSLSYDTHIPRMKNVSTSVLLRVRPCILKAMYIGRGLSLSRLWCVQLVALADRVCFTLLNIKS